MTDMDTVNSEHYQLPFRLTSVSSVGVFEGELFLFFVVVVVTVTSDSGPVSTVVM